MADELDQEIDAIRAVLSALEPLSPDVRISVLGYVVSRLGINLERGGASTAIPLPSSTYEPSPRDSLTPRKSFVHIKDLKEEKKPRSNNEMAALVAYFLAHEAPANERKETINQQDIETYFRIAEYPLPEKPQFTLPNAKAAGYLDLAGGGEYRLNPVGHNLVKHSLPRDGSSSTTTRKRRAKKKSVKKKSAKKRAAKSSKKKRATKKKRTTRKNRTKKTS